MMLPISSNVKFADYTGPQTGLLAKMVEITWSQMTTEKHTYHEITFLEVLTASPTYVY